MNQEEINRRLARGEVKALLDRSNRAYVEITNKEARDASGKPEMHGVVKSVPAGGEFNAEDTIALRYPVRTKRTTEKRTAKRAIVAPDGSPVLDENGAPKIEDYEYDALVEKDEEDRQGDPHAHRIIARKYERRTYVRWKEGANPAPFTAELAKKGWPFDVLDGTSSAVIAHPKATDVSLVAKVSGLKLLEHTLELREPEDD